MLLIPLLDKYFAFGPSSTAACLWQPFFLYYTSPLHNYAFMSNSNLLTLLVVSCSCLPLHAATFSKIISQFLLNKIVMTCSMPLALWGLEATYHQSLSDGCLQFGVFGGLVFFLLLECCAHAERKKF